ncbi:amidohydrolase [Fulvitalea axinellae]|uniref:Omega-amidase YafV n=1 Tax=Fulvitalea axinellae TaxID=1182444 RepID=A0AAU9CD23_9BACT|nr:amidohydrolase [Fulvitalea axinellae]
METLTVKMVQADLVWENTEANLATLEENLEFDDSGKADIIVLPETFNTGFTTNLSLAEMKNGRTFRWMKLMASRHGAAVCGSLLFKEGGKIYNRFLWMNPDGSFLHYDKRHLFSIGGEREGMETGAERLTIEYKGWRIRPLVCYDLRFPVWARNIGEDRRPDYDLMICVASWPASRQEVWDTLLRARAIENQTYVVGVNRSGSDGDLMYPGASITYDFKGKAVSNLGSEDKIENVDLNLGELKTFREKFPVYLDADVFHLA